TNILGLYALDRASSSGASLEASALAALSVSFPNRLWEQPIQKEALRQAHDRCKSVFKVSATDRARVQLDLEGLERAFTEIKESVSANHLPSKEQITKIINQNLPDEKINKFNHHIFAVASVLGLTHGNNGKQTVMKEQEFSRLQKIHDKVVSSGQYKKF